MPCSCGQCDSIEQEFDDRVAKGDLAAYRKHGPAKATRILLDVLMEHGVNGATLLDIGGGVGAIQHELFDIGLKQSVHVDASSAYIRTAQQEAQQRGHIDRVQYQFGDFVQLAAQIDSADIVTLDRVICCYPDMPALVSLSSARAKRYYAIVFPRDSWWMNLAQFAINSFMRLRRSAFRFFIHPTRDIEALVRQNGFDKLLHRKMFIWQVVIYQKQQDAFVVGSP